LGSFRQCRVVPLSLRTPLNLLPTPAAAAPYPLHHPHSPAAGTGVTVFKAKTAPQIPPHDVSRQNCLLSRQLSRRLRPPCEIAGYWPTLWRWPSTSSRCAAMRARPRPAFARWRGSSATPFSRCGSIPTEIPPPLSARAAVHLLLHIRCPPLAPCPPIPLAGFLDSPEGPGPRFYKQKPPLQVLLLALQRKTPFRPCGYRATIHRLAKSLP